MHNDPDLFNGNPWIGGVLLAVMMSVLRVIYDKKETAITRIFLESAICGALTVTAGSALIAMGYDQDWYLFIGGAIGFMGSSTIRVIAYRLIDRKSREME